MIHWWLVEIVMCFSDGVLGGSLGFGGLTNNFQYMQW